MTIINLTPHEITLCGKKISESETFDSVCCTSCNKVLELTDSGAWCAECVSACEILTNKKKLSSSEILQLRRMGMEFCCDIYGNFSWQ